MGRAARCPVGTCYLNGARLPCLTDCWHCRMAARLGVRSDRDSEIVPCPRCGHLPERIEDPGPLPRLNDARGPDCAFCGQVLADATMKYCDSDCFNGARRPVQAGSSESDRFKGIARMPRTFRAALPRPGA